MIHNIQKWVSEQCKERGLFSMFGVSSHWWIRAEPSSGFVSWPIGAMLLSVVPSVRCILREGQFPNSVFPLPSHIGECGPDPCWILGEHLIMHFTENEWHPWYNNLFFSWIDCFLEQIWVHTKMEQKLRRFPTYTLSPYPQPLPLSVVFNWWTVLVNSAMSLTDFLPIISIYCWYRGI